MNTPGEYYYATISIFKSFDLLPPPSPPLNSHFAFISLVFSLFFVLIIRSLCLSFSSTSSPPLFFCQYCQIFVFHKNLYLYIIKSLYLSFFFHIFSASTVKSLFFTKICILIIWSLCLYFFIHIFSASAVKSLCFTLIISGTCLYQTVYTVPIS